MTKNFRLFIKFCSFLLKKFRIKNFQLGLDNKISEPIIAQAPIKIHKFTEIKFYPLTSLLL